MRATGTTTIEHVAREPEIQNALLFFQAMGGQIHWTAPNTLAVEGIAEGTGKGAIEIIPDRNDAATFLLAALLGHGPVTLRHGRADHLLPLLRLLEQMGAALEITDMGQTITLQCDTLHAGNYHVTSRPYPGFSSDWGAMFHVALTQIPGTHIFHETIFARRFAHIPELIGMGARIESLALPVDETLYNFDPDLIAPPAHAIQITAPTSLHGATVHANDVRAGAALVVAGLGAKGQTIVTGIEHIERGHEAFAERLQHLGAEIHIVEEPSA